MAWDPWYESLTNSQEEFYEWVFRTMFPRRYRIVKAAQRVVDAADPVNYMTFTMRVVPESLVEAMNEAHVARHELDEAVVRCPRFRLAQEHAEAQS